MTATIGRIKPHVFQGINPDPNRIEPVEPSMGSQGHPQHSDLYLNTQDPTNILLWVYTFPPHTLRGEWNLIGAVGGTNEVAVGPDQPTDSGTEIWYNPDTGELMVLVNGVWQSAVPPAAPAPEEVIIGPSDPAPKNPGVELWHDTSSRPGTLKARVGDTWEPITGTGTGTDTDEVFIFTTPPTDAGADIWYDNSTRPGVLRVKLPSGEWVEATDDEVHVGPGSTDPYDTDPDATAQLWYGTDSHQLFVRIGGKTGHWEPVSQISPDEVFVGSADPSTFNPAAELWYDISADPGTLKARVSGAWVPIVPDFPDAPDEVLVSPSEPRDQNTELWVDTTTDPGVLKAKMPDGSWAVIAATDEPEPPLDEVWVGTGPPDPVKTYELWYDTTQKILRVKLPNGVWVDVTNPEGTSAAEDEVWVSTTPPRVSIPHELWVDLNFQPPILKAKLPTGQWVPVGAGDSEVTIAPIDPYVSDPSTAADELWLDTSVNPHVFYGRVNGAWVPITGDEVSIALREPTAPETELWVDISVDPAVLMYNHPVQGWLLLAGDEVHVGDQPSDPYLSNPEATAQLWYATDAEQLFVRIGPEPGGHWQPTAQIPPNEVFVGNTTPLPDAELWFDTSNTPPILKAKVNGAWVPVSQDSEPPLDEVWVAQESPDPAGTAEIWYDTSTLPGTLKIKRENGVWEEVSTGDEVHVGDALSDPYAVDPDGATAQLWYATDADQLFVRLGTEPNGYWAPVSELPPNEVMVGPVDPITVNPAAELWFDTSTTPGTLYARVNGAWVAITTPPPDIPNEVLVGPAQPSDITTEIWVDTTNLPPTLKANVNGTWTTLAETEVEVGTTDPYLNPAGSKAELWQDLNFGQNGMLKVRIGNDWRPVGELAADEVNVSATDPIAFNPNSELWVDTSTTPVTLWARVNNGWVQVSGDTPGTPQEVEIGPVDPRDATVELWYDTTTTPGILKANNFGTWEPITGAEVEVANTDPYSTDPESTAELWYDTGRGMPGVLYARVNDDWIATIQYGGVAYEQQYGQDPFVGTQNAAARADHTHGTPPEEVVIDDTDPITTKPDTELWLDISAQPPVLKARVDDDWVTITGPDAVVRDEVLVSPTQPRDITTELWVDTTTDPPILKANVDGIWVDVSAPEAEVEIGGSDPYVTDPASEAEIWYDTDNDTLYVRAGDQWVEATRFGGGVAFEQQYGQEPFEGTLNVAARADHTHGTPAEEVAIGPEDPYVFDPNAASDLWIDTSSDPAVLMGRVDDAWVPVGGPPDTTGDEVWRGAEPPNPVTSTYELWVDSTTDPATLRYKTATGEWKPLSASSEVAVGPTDPRTILTSAEDELWYDTSNGVPGELKAWVGDRWVTVVNYATSVAFEQQYGQDPRAGTLNTVAREDHTHGTPPEEVVISASDPRAIKPDTELWLDISSDPAVLKANVNGDWVEVGGESSSEVTIGNVDPYVTDPAATDELWFDPSMGRLSARVNNQWLEVAPPAPNEVTIQGSEPTNPDVELWYDPDAVSTMDDEVFISAEDPYVLDPNATTELWYDTDAIPREVPGTNEVYVGPTDPILIAPNVDLWYDTTNQSLLVKQGSGWVRVGGGDDEAEVEVSDAEPATEWELWVDTSVLTPPPGVTGLAINDLTDVDTATTAPVEGSGLGWSATATNWVPQAMWKSWSGTQAEYDAIPTKDPATLYAIV